MPTSRGPIQPGRFSPEKTGPRAVTLFPRSMISHSIRYAVATSWIVSIGSFGLTTPPRPE
jgi:hypothetical protein